jgi:rhodanese-related sulfurtransferase
MEETAIRQITAEEFNKLDRDKITILDLREEREIKDDDFSDAIHLPFARIFTELDDVPKDKPVYVLCSMGDWSAEVTEILTDRGYEAYNIEGGYAAFEKTDAFEDTEKRDG